MQQFPGLDILKEFGDISVDVTVDTDILLHDISPKLENTPINFKCNIIAMDNRMTYIKHAYVKCPKCGNGYDKTCDFDKSFDAGYCDNNDCKRKALVVERRTMETDYVQTLLLQEPLEEAVNNSPVIFTAKIYGKHIGQVFPGQKKGVTGIFRSIPSKDGHENAIYIEITHMVDLEEQQLDPPSEADMQRYKKALEQGEFCDKIIDSFAPEVYANELYRDIKLSILLQLVSGVGTSTRRGDINQLLVGDPSMAKSVMLKASQRIVKKSLFTSGKGASSAGLTIGIVKLSDGRSVAQAGVMPLCSGGFAMIDEFDKMNPQDRSSMHEAMEQQQVSIAKAGISMTLPAKTSVLAAANPKYGNYDSELGLAENLDLPPPLLSRMDLIWLILDQVDESLDSAKANHILDNFMDEGSQTNQFMSEHQLMEYLNYARESHPTMNKNIRDVIVKLYNTMRKSATEGMAIGTRQLEALVRLSTAHAKLLLKSEVDEEDVKVVTRLLKSSYTTLGVNLDTGKGMDTNLAGVSKKDNQTRAFWKCFAFCCDENGLAKESEVIKKCAEQEQFIDEENARAFFGKLEHQNMLKQKGNKYEKA
jgi:replicative DNA helicase Mcm